jgi:hypothetical protein
MAHAWPHSIYRLFRSAVSAPVNHMLFGNSAGAGLPAESTSDNSD